jgi:hypothetical protein
VIDNVQIACNGMEVRACSGELVFHLMLSVRVPLVQPQQLQGRGELRSACFTALDLGSGASESLHQKTVDEQRSPPM